MTSSDKKPGGSPVASSAVAAAAAAGNAEASIISNMEQLAVRAARPMCTINILKPAGHATGAGNSLPRSSNDLGLGRTLGTKRHG